MLTAVTGIVLIYSLVPLVWLFVNATKTQSDLFTSFGLWFAGDFALWDNIVATLTYNDGIFLRWFANTVMYVVLGAGEGVSGARVVGAGRQRGGLHG